MDDCTPKARPSETDTTCDNVDDDCDGSIDDDFDELDIHCGQGECQRNGKKKCISGKISDDCAEGQPKDSDEPCNFKDDDCDGSTDEDLPDAFCAHGCPEIKDCGSPIFINNCTKAYFLCSRERTWTEALDHCASIGGHLITISQIEQSFLLEQDLGADGFWIGLRWVEDKRNNNIKNRFDHYHWINEEPFGFHMIEGEMADHCLLVRAKNGGSGHHWIHAACDELHPSICEFSKEHGVPSQAGCADGAREAFDDDTYADVAGCSGGWTKPGISAAPSCGRRGGDDGVLPTGLNCSAADLCAVGWHICKDHVDARDAGLRRGACVTQDDPKELPDLFFASQQSGPGSCSCEETGQNDLFGCGSTGDQQNGACAFSGCSPLTRMTGDLCSHMTTDWDCGLDAYAEATHVVKPSPLGGGVLCCKDPPAPARDGSP